MKYHYSNGMIDVQGRCPACGSSLLFLGDGGHVTCSLDVCPNPSAADELLHGEHTAATPRELALRQRHAWVAAGRCPMCGEPGTDGRLCPDCTTTVRGMRPAERREWRRYEPPATGTPIQSHGYTPAGLLGLDEPAPDTAATEATDGWAMPARGGTVPSTDKPTPDERARFAAWRQNRTEQPDA